MVYQRACNGCGQVTRVSLSTFHQHIGLLVIRFPSHVTGDFCLRCTHRLFWKKSLTTFFLGWWGIISLVMTPIFLVQNIAAYLQALKDLKDSSTPPAPRNPMPPA